MIASNKNLSIPHLNIRSIRKRSKFLEFCAQLPRDKPDIIALTETWLSQAEATMYNIEGYERPSHERGKVEKHRGGGIIIFIKKMYHGEKLENSKMAASTIENVVFKISNTSPKIRVSVCYRHPQSKIQWFSA